MCTEHFTNDAVESLTFFHPGLTSDKVFEIMQKNGNKCGVYLLRPSYKLPGYYCISVMHERDMLHFRINKNGNKFLIGDTSFNDISSLVIHFKSFPIHNEQGYLDVYLKHPICRLHGISSWKDSSLECCSPRVPSDVYLTLTLFNHPGKPSTPELDWVKIPNSPDLGRKNELPYVNDKCGKGPARPCACDWSDQNNLRMSLKNGWVLEPLLVFKSPNGNIHENFPRDVWLSLSQEEREDIEKLSDKFNYLDISKKKVGSSRGHPY